MDKKLNIITVTFFLLLFNIFASSDESSKEETSWSGKVQDEIKKDLEKLRSWFGDVKEGALDKWDDIKGLFSSSADFGNKNFGDKKTYPCGVQNCSLCFESEKNRLKHLLNHHFFKNSSSNEAFLVYPEDDKVLDTALETDKD
ncbi:hypothetical protein KAW80_01955 [Candidatus Babeliales bacterium]|nr:hypothetical protein [Candidatus Babeliales bacterium]